jgi:hypothetical protein
MGKGNKSDTRRNDLITPSGHTHAKFGLHLTNRRDFAHGKVQEEKEGYAGGGDIHLSGYCHFAGGCCHQFLVLKCIRTLGAMETGLKS